MAERGETEAERVWMRIRARFGDPSITTRDGRRRARRDPESSQPFAPGRDPLGVDSVLDRFVRDVGWTAELAQGAVLAEWPRIVGPENAARTEPVGIEDGTLVVRCVSTAWAQQMRLLRANIVTMLRESFPDSKVESIRFVGPDVPSFARGPRSVRGRGPRDTWG